MQTKKHNQDTPDSYEIHHVILEKAAQHMYGNIHQQYRGKNSDDKADRQQENSALRMRLLLILPCQKADMA